MTQLPICNQSPYPSGSPAIGPLSCVDFTFHWAISTTLSYCVTTNCLIIVVLLSCCCLKILVPTLTHFPQLSFCSGFWDEFSRKKESENVVSVLKPGSLYSFLKVCHTMLEYPLKISLNSPIKDFYSHLLPIVSKNSMNEEIALISYIKKKRLLLNTFPTRMSSSLGMHIVNNPLNHRLAGVQLFVNVFLWHILDSYR